MKINKTIILTFSTMALILGSQASFASCSDISSKGDLFTKAKAVVDAKNSGGFTLPMWVTVVDETGKVCEVINTSSSAKDQNGHSNDSWLGSRVISAQKANTANAFSLDGFSISTSNLYGLTQPGGSLYGLQHSNPVDAASAYAGSPNTFGTKGDPMKNKRVGGVNVFGGGLALYTNNKKVGAIGVSGDTSCTDHVVAWKIREALSLDEVPAGFNDLDGKSSEALGDEMVIDSNNALANTVQQPTCAFAPTATLANGVIAE